MKITIVSLALGLLLFSCNDSVKSDQPFIIDLEKSTGNITSVPLSTIGKRLEYVPLETDTACLLKGISQAYMTDSLIFVTDNSKLLKFDINGKFIARIGNTGRGPGEYTRVMNFLIDDNNKEILVLSSRVVLVYDYKGVFKRDIKLDFPGTQFILNEKNEMVFHPYNLPTAGDDPVYSWYFIDMAGTVQRKIENTLKRKNKGLIVPSSPLYMFDNTPHFMEFGVDTLYNFVNDKKEAYAIFVPGKLKYPPDPTISEVTSIKGKVWVYDIRETKKLLFVNLWWDVSDSISNCIFDKSSSIFTSLKDGSFFNDIDGGVNFWPKKIINDNLMLDYKDAFDLISHAKKAQPGTTKQLTQFKNVTDHLSDNSNPVIIILRK